MWDLVTLAWVLLRWDVETQGKVSWEEVTWGLKMPLYVRMMWVVLNVMMMMMKGWGLVREVPDLTMRDGMCDQLSQMKTMEIVHQLPTQLASPLQM